LLHELGGDLNAVDKHGLAPINIAATYGHAATIRALCELGVNANTPNDKGCISMYIAAGANH
jgi:ankyrin repeat protein